MRENKRIYLALTERCNLYCRHCFLGEAKKRNNSLSWEKIKKALGFFLKKGFLQLEITGGEPSLSPLLLRTVKYARKIGYKKIGIDTNGTRPEIIDRFSPKEVNSFTLSLDGATAKTHDFLRQKGHFKTCLSSIKKAVSAGFTVNIVYSVNRKNIGEIEKAVRLLDTLGVSCLSFNFLSFMGAARGHPEILIAIEDWIKIRHLLVKINGLKNLSLRFPLRFVDKKEHRKVLDEGYRCILENPDQALVFADGNIFECCLLTEKEEMASFKVTDKKVISYRHRIESFLKYRPDSPCPVQEMLCEEDGVPVLPKDIVPLCVYWKKIIPPQGKDAKRNKQK